MTGACLGDLVFEVSANTVKTFDQLKFTRKAALSEHKVHGGRAVPEFTGFDADTATFRMVLSAYLGVNPQKAIGELEEMLLSQKAYTLVLGESVLGKWAIKQLGETYERIHKDGVLISCSVDVSLIRTE